MKEELEVGQTYQVEHQHKGNFTILLEAFDADFAKGQIANGFAKAIHPCNRKEIGDKITLIRAQCALFLANLAVAS